MLLAREVVGAAGQIGISPARPHETHHSQQILSRRLFPDIHNHHPPPPERVSFPKNEQLNSSATEPQRGDAFIGEGPSPWNNENPTPVMTHAAPTLKAYFGCLPPCRMAAIHLFRASLVPLAIVFLVAPFITRGHCCFLSEQSAPGVTRAVFGPFARPAACYLDICTIGPILPGRKHFSLPSPQAYILPSPPSNITLFLS